MTCHEGDFTLQQFLSDLKDEGSKAYMKMRAGGNASHKDASQSMFSVLASGFNNPELYSSNKLRSELQQGYTLTDTVGGKHISELCRENQELKKKAKRKADELDSLLIPSPPNKGNAKSPYVSPSKGNAKSPYVSPSKDPGNQFYRNGLEEEVLDVLVDRDCQLSPSKSLPSPSKLSSSPPKKTLTERVVMYLLKNTRKYDLRNIQELISIMQDVNNSHNNTATMVLQGYQSMESDNDDGPLDIASTSNTMMNMFMKN